MRRGRSGRSPRGTAPSTSIAGSIQVVARSIETAMHKLHELKFDVRDVRSEQPDVAHCRRRRRQRATRLPIGCHRHQTPARAACASPFRYFGQRLGCCRQRRAGSDREVYRVRIHTALLGDQLDYCDRRASSRLSAHRQSGGSSRSGRVLRAAARDPAASALVRCPWQRSRHTPLANRRTEPPSRRSGSSLRT